MWQPDCLACHVPHKPTLNARRCGRMLGPHPHLWKMLWSPRGHANCSHDEGLVRSSVPLNDIMIALIVAVWVPSPNDLTSPISPRIKRHNNWIGGLRRADPLHTSAHSYTLKHTSCTIGYDTLCPFSILFSWTEMFLSFAFLERSKYQVESMAAPGMASFPGLLGWWRLRPRNMLRFGEGWPGWPGKPDQAARTSQQDLLDTLILLLFFLWIPWS